MLRFSLPVGVLHAGGQMLKKFLAFLIFLMLCVLSMSNLFHPYQWDLTQNKANSLSTASEKLLDQLKAPLNITCYSPNIEMLNLSYELLKPYKKHSAWIKVNLEQTTLEPHLGKSLKLSTEHNLIVEYNGVMRGFDITTLELNERKISTAIQDTINQTQQWLVFLTGHEELDPLDTSELGISNFAQLFKTQGMQIAKLNLAEQQSIPKNTNVLIVANPQQDFLPIEKALLKQYIDNGGNILWFTEPDSPVTALLTENFGVTLTRGVAVDPDSLKLGSPHPALKIMPELPSNQILNDIDGAIILPWSGNLELKYKVADWHEQLILATSANSWLYAGPATMEMSTLSAHKQQAGPLNIAFAFSRSVHEGEQHAIVIADSSFMLNKYLNLYSNAKLTTELLDWVQNDVNYFVFNPNPIRDLSYHPNNLDVWLFKYLFNIFLPLLMVGLGFYLQRRSALA